MEKGKTTRFEQFALVLGILAILFTVAMIIITALK